MKEHNPDDEAGSGPLTETDLGNLHAAWLHADDAAQPVKDMKRAHDDAAKAKRVAVDMLKLAYKLKALPDGAGDHKLGLLNQYCRMLGLGRQADLFGNEDLNPSFDMDELELAASPARRGRPRNDLQ